MTTDTNRAATPALTPEQRNAIKRERTQAVRDQFQHELNVAYGPDPKQVLDIYHPAQAGPAPVLVFLHGGGFRNGAPANEGYLGGPILARGAIYVAMGYRLLPDARHADSYDDVERGLLWLHEHIAEHGGDPSRIFLSGTSAGAILVAGIALRPWAAQPGLPDDLIKGLVLFSGFYDLDHHVPDGEVDLSRYRLVHNIARTPPHIIVSNTVDESAFPDAPAQAEALVAALKAKGASVERFVQPEADHFTSPRSLADGSGAVFEAVTRMMRLG
jgi:arylformamidase